MSFLGVAFASFLVLAVASVSLAENRPGGPTGGAPVHPPVHPSAVHGWNVFRAPHSAVHLNAEIGRIREGGDVNLHLHRARALMISYQLEGTHLSEFLQRHGAAATLQPSEIAFHTQLSDFNRRMAEALNNPQRTPAERVSDFVEILRERETAFLNWYAGVRDRAEVQQRIVHRNGFFGMAGTGAHAAHFSSSITGVGADGLPVTLNLGTHGLVTRGTETIPNPTATGSYATHILGTATNRNGSWLNTNGYHTLLGERVGEVRTALGEFINQLGSRGQLHIAERYIEGSLRQILEQAKQITDAGRREQVLDVIVSLLAAPQRSGIQVQNVTSMLSNANAPGFQRSLQGLHRYVVLNRRLLAEYERIEAAPGDRNSSAYRAWSDRRDAWLSDRMVEWTEMGNPFRTLVDAHGGVNPHFEAWMHFVRNPSLEFDVNRLPVGAMRTAVLGQRDLFRRLREQERETRPDRSLREQLCRGNCLSWLMSC